MFGDGREPSGLINLADKVSTVSHTLEGTSNQPSTAVSAHINSSRRGLTPTAEAEKSVQTLCTWLSLINSGNTCPQLENCCFLKTSSCHRLESSKYERIPKTRSHQREIELVNMSNNLYGVNATNLSSVVSTPPPLKNQLETRLDDV